LQQSAPDGDAIGYGQPEIASLLPLGCDDGGKSLFCEGHVAATTA
jgi:hypothetical protein